MHFITNKSTTQRTQDVIITSLWRQNDVATSFWRDNDVVIASCARWGWVLSVVCRMWTESCPPLYVFVWQLQIQNMGHGRAVRCFVYQTNLKIPTMHPVHSPQFIIQNRNVHISVLNSPLWGMEQAQCGMYQLGKLWALAHTCSKKRYNNVTFMSVMASEITEQAPNHYLNQ